MPVDSCQGTSGFPRLWDTRIPARDEEICPAVCLEPGMQFLPLTNSTCKDCNQMHYADICQNVTEIMVPCPVDDGTRDCCEVQSCFDPNNTALHCANSTWHPPAYLDDLIAIQNYFAS